MDLPGIKGWIHRMAGAEIQQSPHQAPLRGYHFSFRILDETEEEKEVQPAMDGDGQR